MSTGQRTELAREQQEEILELYYQRRIDLEGMCQLAAALGSQPDRDAVDVAELARELGLYVHEKMTVRATDPRLGQPEDEAPGEPEDAADDADEGSATRRVGELPKSDTPLLRTSPGLPVASGDDEEDAGDATVMLGGEQRQAHERRLERAAGKPSETTPLQAWCLEQGVMPRVQSPGMAREGPALDGAGDRLYAWGSELGRGGVGRVHLGVDRDLRRSVALKTLRKESLADPIQVQAFVEEAIVTGGLEHPNVVPMYSLGYSEEHGPYYAMKRLAGEPLSTVIRQLRNGENDADVRYNLFRLMAFFVEIAQAIAFAHDRGVIHCDLKPSNVIVGEFGEVTVVDWGLARVLGEKGQGQARALLTSGTPAYMPPEQATGRVEELDEQSDIWSLGAILYELLTLTVPFEADTSELTIIKLLADEVEPPSERAPDRPIPATLEKICMRALHKDKLERYASVRQMLGEVQAYVEGTRERQRRRELAREAREKAERFLDRASDAEDTVDETQTEVLERRAAGALHDELAPLERQLDDARDDLVFAYNDAARALERGLDALPDDPRLQKLLGDLYWRVFGRLYPARVAPPVAVREQGMALLAQLSERSLAAIVTSAHEHAPSFAPSRSTLGRAATDDPWLRAVLSFVGDDHGAYDPVTAPGAIAPLVERIAFLKAVSLFADMSGSDLLPIAEGCDMRRYPAGVSIFSQGDPGDALYVVMEGNVDIVRDDSILTRLGPTDCFGEIAVLDQAPRTAGARCASDVQCLILTAERFRRIVRDNGNIGLSVIGVLTARLRNATDREAALRQSLDR